MNVKIGESPEATIAVNDRGMIVAWNHAAERLFERSAADAIGAPCHQLMHGYTSAGAPICAPDCAVIAICRRGDAPRTFEMILHRPDGSTLRTDVTSATLHEGGETIAIHIFTPNLAAAASYDNPVRKTLQEGIRSKLTPRELETLRLLGEGLGTQEIATRLHLTRATVRNHIYSLLPKLGVHTRVEAVVLALNAGLVQMH